LDTFFDRIRSLPAQGGLDMGGIDGEGAKEFFDRAGLTGELAEEGKECGRNGVAGEVFGENFVANGGHGSDEDEAFDAKFDCSFFNIDGALGINFKEFCWGNGGSEEMRGR
jgi:hypothetical protein